MQSRARATRKTITETAGQIFSDVGFTNASLEEISDRAGTSIDAISRYFSSKDLLAQAVLEDFHSELGAFCAVMLEREGSPLQSMMLLSFGWGRRILSDPIVAGGVRLSIERPELLVIPNYAYDPWIATISALMVQACERGEMAQEIEVETVTRFLIGDFIGAQIMSREFTAYEDLEERLVDLWRYSLIGLLPRASRTEIGRLIDQVLLELETLSPQPWHDDHPHHLHHDAPLPSIEELPTER